MPSSIASVLDCNAVSLPIRFPTVPATGPAPGNKCLVAKRSKNVSNIAAPVAALISPTVACRQFFSSLPRRSLRISLVLA